MFMDQKVPAINQDIQDFDNSDYSSDFVPVIGHQKVHHPYLHRYGVDSSIHPTEMFKVTKYLKNKVIKNLHDHKLMFHQVNSNQFKIDKDKEFFERLQDLI